CKRDEAARPEPVDDALDGGGIHGDERAELVLRRVSHLGELGEGGELRRRQLADMPDEDGDVALARLAQREADLVLQMVGRRLPVAVHRSPSSPLTSHASSPPMREWTRPPLAMASTNRISSGRGPSGADTEIASKWLRT